MDGERNSITMEQNYYIREKLRTPIVVQEKHERGLSQGEQKGLPEIQEPENYDGFFSF